MDLRMAFGSIAVLAWKLCVEHTLNIVACNSVVVGRAHGQEKEEEKATKARFYCVHQGEVPQITS